MNKQSWVENPTKKQAFTFGVIGLVGMVLLLLSMTDFLTESPFQGKYFGLHLLFISSAWTTTRILKNYYRQAKK